MPSIRTRLALLLIVALAAFTITACGDDDDGDSGGSATGTTTQAAEACSKEGLALVNPGQLTVGTDKPAFPPYFVDDDPTNGKGFESAVAYAVADELGFGKDEVEWTVVPFNSSYAPGPKDFDFDINQISITPDREKAVDFSEPYYLAPQAVVVGPDSELGEVSSLADLKDATIGVQIGTTSLDAVDRGDPAVGGPEGLQRLERRGDRAQAEPGGRGGGGPADRLLHHGRAGRGLRDRRAVQRARRRRLRAPAREGLGADPVPERRARRPRVER